MGIGWQGSNTCGSGDQCMCICWGPPNTRRIPPTSGSWYWWFFQRCLFTPVRIAQMCKKYLQDRSSLVWTSAANASVLYQMLDLIKLLTCCSGVNFRGDFGASICTDPHFDNPNPYTCHMEFRGYCFVDIVKGKLRNWICFCWYIFLAIFCESAMHSFYFLHLLM